MPYPDVDRLLREERFDELARLSALPPGRRMGQRSVANRIARQIRSRLAPARIAAPGTVTIRHAQVEDRPAVERLAGIEDRLPPRGAVLIAEIDEQILAALPLDGTAPVSDPLRPTAGLIDLLELRLRQLERDVPEAA